MKKIVWYLPAIVYTIAVIALKNGFSIITPLWYVWCALLWLSGFLFDNQKVWGGYFGIASSCSSFVYEYEIHRSDNQY